MDDFHRLKKSINKFSCDNIVSELLLSNQKFVKLKETIQGNINIKCNICKPNGIEGNARAYLADDPLEITICSNRVQNRSDIEEALTHELIHAFDYSNKRYDLRSCEGLASSEIRANKFAECKDIIFPSIFKNACAGINGSRCTANIFPTTGWMCTANVYNHAIYDDAPFENIDVSSLDKQKDP